MQDLTRVRPETGGLIQHDGPVVVDDFHSHKIRRVTINGELMFRASDICIAGGLTNVSMALDRVPAAQKGYIRIPDVTPQGGRPEAWYVTEPGAYMILMRSNKPEAIALQERIAEIATAWRRGQLGPVAPDLATLPATQILVIAQRLVEAEARAEHSEAVVDAIEAADGITITKFHKHYFSDVQARQFFEALYSLDLLIDQRGTRGRDEKGRLKNGREHLHPKAKGKQFFYLHGSLDRDGARRESVRVRPGRPETDLVRFLTAKGLPPNPNALTANDTPRLIEGDVA